MTKSSAAAVCRLAAALAMAMLFGSHAAAQQPAPDGHTAPGGLTLDQLMNAEVQTVFGASRFLQRVIDAPASVSVVTSEEIERFGYRTLGEILQGMRGLYVTYDRNYSYVGVRGFSRHGDYNSRVLLLVDGHRLNDNVYDQAPVGTEFPIDVALIERVEVVRGPSSTLYGTNAFFAVVNVVTKRGRDLEGFSGAAEIGHLGTRHLRATYGGELPASGQFLISGNVYGSDGQQSLNYPEYDAQPGGGRAASELDRDALSQIFASGSIGGWSAHAVFANREKGVPTGAFGTALDDPRSQTIDRRAYGDLQYRAEVRGTSVFLRGAYDRYSYRGDYWYLRNGQRLAQDDRGEGEWWAGEVGVTRRIGRAHLASAGMELRSNVRQDQTFVTQVPGELPLNDVRGSRIWSAYLQDEFTVSERVLVNAGVGYDAYELFGHKTTFRGAVIFKPRPDRALKALYGTAFRAPNVYELYYFAIGDTVLDLQPETIRTAELAWEQYLAGGLRVSASVYNNRSEDLISQVQEPRHWLGFGFANVDGLRATGIGVEAEGTLATNVQALGSYSFNVVRQGTPGTWPTNSPRHVFKGRLTMPLFHEQLFVGAEGRFIGDRRTLRGATADGAFVGRLTLTSRELSGALTLGLTVDNIFNARYADPASEEHLQDVIGQDGRTARLRITWRL